MTTRSGRPPGGSGPRGPDQAGPPSGEPGKRGPKGDRTDRRGERTGREPRRRGLGADRPPGPADARPGAGRPDGRRADGRDPGGRHSDGPRSDRPRSDRPYRRDEGSGRGPGRPDRHGPDGRRPDRRGPDGPRSDRPHSDRPYRRDEGSGRGPGRPDRQGPDGRRPDRRGPDSPRPDRPRSDRPYRRDEGSGRGPGRPDRHGPGGRRPDRPYSDRPYRRDGGFDRAPREPRPARAARLSEVKEIEISIDKLVAGGEGLGRFEGIAIFVPRSAPGDRLRVRLVDRRPDFGRAEIVEILEPGPGRRTPPCPHFAACGGCDLQHLEDRRQLAYKVAAVRESLTHIGKISLPEVIPVVAGDAWGYRLRAQLHTDTTERGLEVGYYARGSRDLVPIDCCPVLAPELEKLVPALPDLLRDQPRPRIDLAVGDGDKVSSAPPVDGLPRGPIKLTVGAFTYRFDARCFFQGHRGLLPELVAQVIGPWEGERAFDLFAGVGLFTLPLAERYGRVVAVEGNRIAARYAQQNVSAATGIGRVSVENLALESWIEAFPEDADRAIVDPPRAGLPLRVCAALIAKRPRILTYVSCHAATLARDLRELQRGYRIESIRFIDLFPQTGHLETIVHLRALEDQPGRDSVSSEGPTQAEPAGPGRGGEDGGR